MVHNRDKGEGKTRSRGSGWFPRNCGVRSWTLFLAAAISEPPNSARGGALPSSFKVFSLILYCCCCCCYCVMLFCMLLVVAVLLYVVYCFVVYCCCCMLLLYVFVVAIFTLLFTGLLQDCASSAQRQNWDYHFQARVSMSPTTDFPVRPVMSASVSQGICIRWEGKGWTEHGSGKL